MPVVRMCLFILLATIAAPSTAWPAIPFAEDIYPELRGLMEAASMDGPQFQLGELRIEERHGDLEVVQGQARPQVRLFTRALGSYEIREDIDNTSRVYGNGSLSVTKPFYDWGNLERREEVAQQRIAIEENQSLRTGSGLFMQLRRTYLEWLLMRERKNTLEQSINLSASYVDARRQLLEAGRSSEQEVLEMEARLMENQESLAWVENRERELELTLEHLTGKAIDFEGLGGKPLTLIQPVSEDEFRKLTGGGEDGDSGLNYPEAANYAFLESIEDKNLDSLDRNNWPTFDLVAGVFADQLDSINQQDSVLRVQFYAGVQMNWNIFDGWQTDGRKRSTLARKRAFAMQHRMAVAESRNRYEGLCADILLNLKQVEARAKRQAVLERRLELLRQQVQLAQVSGTDLIEAEIDYLEVRQRLMEARVNYLLNFMELGILLGEDPAETLYRNPS
jgi:outer membrane protein TolC